MGVVSQYSINMSYRAISLPPVKDILVLGRRFPQGKAGVMECFRFIAPDEFQMFDIGPEDDVVEAVLINKLILKRMPAEKVIAALQEHVFPYVSPGEAINVDFNITVNVSGAQVPREL